MENTDITFNKLLDGLEFNKKTINIVFDGDSIALGVGASPEMTLSKQVGKLLKYQSNLHVVAQGGRQLSECLDTFDQRVTVLYDQNANRNIVFLKAGDNDVTRGIPAETTYRKLVDYVILAHKNNWEIIVATNLQRFDVSKELQDELSIFNKMVANNEFNADSIVDFAADITIGGYDSRKNSAYYNSDGVHPADLGYEILAYYIVSVI